MASSDALASRHPASVQRCCGPPRAAPDYCRGYGRNSGPAAARNRIARGSPVLHPIQGMARAIVVGRVRPLHGRLDRGVSERIESLSEGYFRKSIEAVDGDPYNQVQYANISTVIGNQNLSAGHGEHAPFGGESQSDAGCQFGRVSDVGPGPLEERARTEIAHAQHACRISSTIHYQIEEERAYDASRSVVLQCPDRQERTAFPAREPGP